MTAKLLSRLQGLTAPDREVDALIYDRFYHPTHKPSWPFSPGSKLDHRVPRFTESLDAAVALCERVLPGLHRALFQHPDRESLAVLSVPGMGDEGAANGHHKSSLCIALLIAILTALEARDGKD